MTILVIAEHDNASIKAATLNTIAAAQKIGGDIHVLVAGHNAQAAADAAAKIAGVAKVLLADAPQLAAGLAENVEATVLNDREGLLAHPRAGDRLRQEHRAAYRREAGRRADQRHHRRRFAPTRSSARSTRATRSPPCNRADPIKVITVRSTGFDPVAAEGGSASVEKIEAAADAGISQFVSREVTKLDRPELTSREDHRLGRPRSGQRRELHEGAGTAGRQARTQRSAHRAQQSMRASSRTIIRSARPARSSRRSCTSQSASRARSSIWPA